MYSRERVTITLGRARKEQVDFKLKSLYGPATFDDLTIFRVTL